MSGDLGDAFGHLAHPSPMDLEAVIEAKGALRLRLREQRKQRSARQRAQASAAIADLLDSIPEVREAGTVAAYAARPAEPDTLAWLDRAIGRGQKVMLPVLGAGLARNWAYCDDLADLTERAPGRPPEPSTGELGAEAVAAADVVIAPALAIDTRGRRLGQGGGWFDRMLALVPRGVPVIALVFDDELFDGDAAPLPHEPHDLHVTAVVTPSGWRNLGS